MSMTVPYFLTDTRWFTIEEDENGNETYHLTKDAPEKARKSYEEFINYFRDYSDKDKFSEGGYTVLI